MPTISQTSCQTSEHGLLHHITRYAYLPSFKERHIRSHDRDCMRPLHRPPTDRSYGVTLPCGFRSSSLGEVSLGVTARLLRGGLCPTITYVCPGDDGRRYQIYDPTVTVFTLLYSSRNLTLVQSSSLAHVFFPSFFPLLPFCTFNVFFFFFPACRCAYG